MQLCNWEGMVDIFRLRAILKLDCPFVRTLLCSNFAIHFTMMTTEYKLLVFSIKNCPNKPKLCLGRFDTIQRTYSTNFFRGQQYFFGEKDWKAPKKKVHLYQEIPC